MCNDNSKPQYMTNIDPNFPIISDFLKEIGITVVEKSLTEPTFLPGIKIVGHTIYVDRSLLIATGDILHEAGHLAVTEAEFRDKIGTPEVPTDWPKDGDEFGAMLWSYAALTHLKLPSEVVFHDDGYKDQADWLREQYAAGTYIGLPLFIWMGFCDDEVQFPRVKKWLR